MLCGVRLRRQCRRQLTVRVSRQGPRGHTEARLRRNRRYTRKWRLIRQRLSWSRSVSWRVCVVGGVSRVRALQVNSRRNRSRRRIVQKA